MDQSELSKYELLIDESMQCVREQGIVGRITRTAYPEFIEQALKEAIPRTKSKVPQEDLVPLIKEICRRVQATIPLAEGLTFAQSVVMGTYREDAHRIYGEIYGQLNADGIDRHTLRNKMAAEIKGEIRKKLKALDSIPESDVEYLTEGIFISLATSLYPLGPNA